MTCNTVTVCTYRSVILRYIAKNVPNSADHDRTINYRCHRPPSTCPSVLTINARDEPEKTRSLKFDASCAADTRNSSEHIQTMPLFYLGESYLRSTCAGSNVSCIQRTSAGHTLGRAGTPIPTCPMSSGNVLPSSNVPTGKRGKTVSSVLPTFKPSDCTTKSCSFIRPLTPVEWDVLRSYTRRIRYMVDHSGFLNWESVETFLGPAIGTEPLFPNLRSLYSDCEHHTENQHLINMPFPSLTSLYLVYEGDLGVLPGSLESFSEFSHNIGRLFIQLPGQNGTIALSNILSSCICRWRNLQTVHCPQIALDVDALVHLSCMPALTRLAFRLNATVPDQIPPSDSPMIFSHLHELTLHSESLDPISRLLSQTQMPAITGFSAFIKNQPSKLNVRLFLASVQTSFIGDAIQKLHLEQVGPTYVANSRPILGFEELQPFMAFNNLRRFHLDISWSVDVTTRELLALASAWPHLEWFSINAKWGWSSRGITPDGLSQLLQMCRSLRQIALAVDTRDYTECRQSLASLGLTSPPLSIHVIDSTLEQESVSAISAFFAGITFSSSSFYSLWRTVGSEMYCSFEPVNC